MGGARGVPGKEAIPFPPLAVRSAILGFALSVKKPSALHGSGKGIASLILPNYSLLTRLVNAM